MSKIIFRIWRTPSQKLDVRMDSSVRINKGDIIHESIMNLEHNLLRTGDTHFFAKTIIWEKIEGEITQVVELEPFAF